jgi:hypothetical protein
MSRTTRTSDRAGWAAWARPAVALGLALPAGLLLGAPSAAATDDDGLRLQALRCHAGVCLHPVTTLDDSDGDGVSDDDERAMGTDPYDAASVPPVLDVLDAIGRELLPSFERGITEVVVLPTGTIDGRALGEFSPLASIPLEGREDALTRLGISSALLTEHGVAGDSVVSVMVQQGTKAERPAFGVRVGGVDASLISAGLQPVRSMGEPGTATATGDSGGRSTAESQSFTTLQPWLEEITQTITGSVTRDADGNIVDVTHRVETTATDWTEANPKPVPTGSYCTSSSGTGCTQPSPEQKKAEEEAKNKAEEESKKKAEEEAKKQEEAAKKAEEERKKAEEEKKKQEEAAKKKQYINPDAEFAVVVTQADIERVLTLTRSTTTTPVQDAPELPELDPDVLVDDADLIGYWEGPRQQAIPEPLPEPTRSADQVTTYVPGFEPPLTGELPPVGGNEGTWLP